jgi:hypothetical protein
MTKDMWNIEDLDEVKWNAFDASEMLKYATEFLSEMRVIQGLRNSYILRSEDFDKIHKWYTVMQQKAQKRLYELGWKSEEE